MDLSKLSDADLFALKAGDLAKVSDAGLMQLKEQSKNPTLAWSDVPVEAVKNLPQSAANFAGGIYQAIRHPVTTAGNVFDAAAGGLRNITPKPLADFIDSLDANPQSTQRATQTANALGNLYRDKYGSVDGFKNALATDPVGVAGDVSTVLGLGSAASTGKLSSALSKASQYTNPMSTVSPVVKGLAKAADAVGSPILGMATGVGAENVRMAGRAGLQKKTAFMENAAGKANMADVLDAARQNVQKMGVQKLDEYKSNMAAVRNDKSVLSFGKIDEALNNADGMVRFKGQAKNQKAAEAVSKIRDEVQAWKQLDPAEFHTPEGLDALKQRIGGIVESIPFEEKTARAAAKNVYNSVKGEISTQAPSYSKAMKDYAEASETIQEIERALSLNPNASVDTAMRKLQSLARNNVNTNYGNRLELARKMESQGGNEILPAIAGQAMNSWTPRSLTGQAGGLATLGTVLSGVNPMALALLPLQSPRAVGTALYAGGRAVGATRNALANLPGTKQQTLFNALLANQAGSIPTN